MRKFYAILGIVFTLVLGVYGLSGYSSGAYDMAFFGMRLSKGAFGGLILLFLLYDVFAVKNAFGRDKSVEQMNAQALTRAQDAVPLEGEPCTIRLTRLPSVVGCAMGVRVVLNGVEHGMLKNGATMEMTTQRAQNELSVHYTADSTSKSVTFEAQPGGQLAITLKYTGAVLTVRDAADDQPLQADAKGRYRRLKTLYLVFSIADCLVCFLGLIPLVKTLRAAKNPDEAAAQLQLHSAGIWITILTAVLAVAYISYIIIRMTL